MNKSYTGGSFEPLLNPLWIHLNPTVSVMVSNTKREWIVFIALRSYKGDDTEYFFTIMSCISEGEIYTAIHSRMIPGLRTCGRSNDQFHLHMWEVSHKDLCENFKAHVKVIFSQYVRMWYEIWEGLEWFQFEHSLLRETLIPFHLLKIVL